MNFAPGSPGAAHQPRASPACPLPLSGHYAHTLDAKQRLTIPSGMRVHLTEGALLRRGADGNLELWPAKVYEAQAQERLDRLTPLSSAYRHLRRQLYGSSQPVQLDSAGRIVIPPDYAEHAAITKDVAIVGVGEAIELWDAERWRVVDAEMAQDQSELDDPFSHPG